ncbi:MAG: ankyrin repeat domain-containing protein [Pirellulaceae bacterium]
MRYKTVNSLRARLVDHDGAIVSSEPLSLKLDGLACHSDSVLNYADLPFAEDTALRGGYPRLVVDEKGNLTISVEVDSRRKLKPTELRALREDFAGQLTDGIGAGCFDELTTVTGIAVTPRFPLSSKCTQTEGTAWRPMASTKKGNEQRVAAAAKLVEKMDLAPRKAGAPRSTAHQKDAVKIRDKQENKPNLNKLFRLLAKPERNQLFDQIKAELEACGNDLTMVRDGEYPYGNFSDPKLLRLLLNAGLPPETTDVKRNSLLIQAACDPKSIELLLKHSANINRVCDGSDATALIRAARLGKRRSVELLLTYGADPAIRNKAGRAAIDVVDKRSRDRQVIIDLLQSRSRELSKE